ncbi:sigma-70 family RNA polymerase sigma factor [Agromyces soli]
MHESEPGAVARRRTTSTPYPHSEHEPNEPSDEEILHAIRCGDDDAYGIFWRRHRSLAIAVARSTTSRFDPEDIAAESFARVLAAIRRGRGPVRAFRPYLVTVVRNTAMTWGMASHEIPVADPYDLVDQSALLEPGASAMVEERESPVMIALRSLPDRLRTVLWYGVVEGYSPVEIARLLDITPNAAGVLAFRAREALRQAWIQVQIAPGAMPQACSATIDQLGALARGTLPSTRRGVVLEHLHDCPPCAGIERRARDLSVRFGSPRRMESPEGDEPPLAARALAHAS